MPATRPAGAGFDLSAIDAITEAVESGAGLPEVVRAAARALDASLALIDRSSAVLAVAARSAGDERSLLAGGEGVVSHDLRRRRHGGRSAADAGPQRAPAPA